MAQHDTNRAEVEPTEVPPWQHDHVFGQDRRRPGELRTLIVIVLTAAMMVLEIAAGVAFGSMALLADGLHMASHASALVISLFAYVYDRRQAHDEQYCFGTGKVNSLAGFTGAVLLALFALLMAWESCGRLLHPVEIAFNQAIGVAILGLIVNGLSVFVLGGGDRHDHHDEGDEESDPANRRPKHQPLRVVAPRHGADSNPRSNASRNDFPVSPRRKLWSAGPHRRSLRPPPGPGGPQWSDVASGRLRNTTCKCYPLNRRTVAKVGLAASTGAIRNTSP